MEQHHVWRTKKLRDLARSTCSPLKSVAQEARKVKRNANRRQRHAQKLLLVDVLKNHCLGCDDSDSCERCDLETSLTEIGKSRPKLYPWYLYSGCHERRWEWDKFSQLIRWADSRHAELSLVDFNAEIRALGESPAHKHAIFHLLLIYFDDGFNSAPKMSAQSLKTIFREHGIDWKEKVLSNFQEIGNRICMHGNFSASDRWVDELCQELSVLRDPEVALMSHSSRHQNNKQMTKLDDKWCFEERQRGHWTVECAYRPLLGTHDVEAWATEIMKLFEVMWGPRFLETPQGQWIVGDLIVSSIPRIN
jgi:hypothetical protein